MDRREFMGITGAGVAALALPARLRAGATAPAGPAIERKAAELLSRMTLEEKVSQMHGKIEVGHAMKRLFAPGYPSTWTTPDNKRLGIPGFNMIDGPRGVGTGRATCFPVSMCRGATWDPELERRIGGIMGYEARALGADVVLSPCINLLWHPSWGRAQETYGEDQLILGRMGVANTLGIQEHALACPKHYAVNNIDESRFYLNAVVDERTLREVYLPHFKMCSDAGAASIMSAYNDLNGELCAHNDHLIRQILKGEWGFSGFVVSDWSLAVEDTVEAVMAGLDMEQPTGAHFGRKLVKAVREGLVPESVVDEAVTRILRQKLRFNISDDPSAGYDKSRVASKEFTDTALEAARKGIVLLKNEGALPLDRNEVKKVALLGRLAGEANLGDLGSSNVNPPWAVSPLQGMRDRARGVEILHEPGGSLASARKAAAGADAAVLVVGFTWRDEGEGGIHLLKVGGDREDISLHDDDVRLIEAAVEVNDRVIVVMEGGAAITVGEWKDRAGAILMAWYPGMEGGHALADILFGEVNPSGKLPIVFPRSLGQLYEFDNKAKRVEYGYLHGYRYLEDKGEEPEWHFGRGLSYTTYEYSNLRLARARLGKADKLIARVDVKNTGGMAGEEVVQLYVSAPGKAVTRPKKDLKDFARVELQPGEKKTVTLEVEVADLAYYDVDAKGWRVEAGSYTALVGPSSDNKELLQAGFGVRP